MSACELTETYSPAAIDIAPATRPAIPATSTGPCDELAAATPADSFLWTRAEGVAETTRGGDTKAVKGPALLEEELAGLRFRISPDAFFQTNTEMAERLYGAATEFAGLHGREKVLDLFCGIGTIGLTLASTFLAAELIRQIPIRLADNGIPQQVIDQFGQASGSGQLDLTGTGDLGERILAATPPQFQDFLRPMIPNIVLSIHEAFSLAIASTMWVGILAALIAGVLCLFIKEVPLVQATEEPAAEAVPAT